MSAGRISRGETELDGASRTADTTSMRIIYQEKATTQGGGGRIFIPVWATNK